MKKTGKMVALFLVVCLLTPTWVVSARVADVPTDHWAYQAVVSLVNKGYLAVYEDGTFQGTRAVDRYTLAVTLARILDEIEAGRVTGSLDDAGLLRELTTEFREELVQWYKDRDEVENKLSETQRSSKATDERLNRVVGAQMGLQSEVQEIKAQLAAEIEQRDAELGAHKDTLQNQEHILKMHQEIIEGQDAVLKGQSRELSEQQEKLGELRSAFTEVEGQVLQYGKDIGRLENWAAENRAVFASLSQTDAELRASIKEIEDAIWALGEDAESQIAAERQRVDEDITDLQRDLATRQQALEENQAQIQQKLDDFVARVGRTDGDFIRTLEQNRALVDGMVKRMQELERDLQNIAVRLQRESQVRADQHQELVLDVDNELRRIQRSLELLTTQVGISEDELAELNRKITEEISLQMNATLIREQRLERQLRELQDEFSSFKATVEEENKSLKGSATLAMVIAAVGILVGFIR